MNKVPNHIRTIQAKIRQNTAKPHEYKILDAWDANPNKGRMDGYAENSEYAEDQQEQVNKVIRQVFNGSEANYQAHLEYLESTNPESAATAWQRMHERLGIDPPVRVSQNGSGQPTPRNEYDAKMKVQGCTWNPNGYWQTPELMDALFQLKHHG